LKVNGAAAADYAQASGSESHAHHLLPQDNTASTQELKSRVTFRDTLQLALRQQLLPACSHSVLSALHASCTVQTVVQSTTPHGAARTMW
jgi:hypothetical protein